MKRQYIPSNPEAERGRQRERGYFLALDRFIPGKAPETFGKCGCTLFKIVQDK
jgi:hypothetical protein